MPRRRSKLPRHKQRRLIEHFAAATPTRTAAQHVEIDNPFEGPVEIDESYLGGRRKGKREGKRGRGAAGKVPVFGLLKRGGRGYTVMIPDAKRATLMPIIKQQVKPDSVVYTDSFVSYDMLDVAGFRHHRINHREGFSKGKGSHLNGIAHC